MLVEKRLEFTIFVIINKLPKLHHFYKKYIFKMFNYILQHWMILCRKMRRKEEASWDWKTTASVKIASARKKKCLWGEQKFTGHRLECYIPVIFQVCWVTHTANALSRAYSGPREPKPHFSTAIVLMLNYIWMFCLLWWCKKRYCSSTSKRAEVCEERVHLTFTV